MYQKFISPSNMSPSDPRVLKLPELRGQLNEQLRALDGRVEAQVSLLTELQEWIRRRAELHQEYASKLDKMAKSLQARHKDQKVKREQWDLASAYNCWSVLVGQTKRDARDHAAMAEVYHNNIVPRFTHIQDDVHRIYKRCREIAYESHEELLKVLHELHTSLRTYHTYQADHRAAQAKLSSFQEQRAKLQAAVPKEKLDKSKKFRVIEKEIQKRNNKYLDAKLKAIKARNEYLLCMESANAAIHKYFVEDLSDIIDAMDFGLHNSLARALLTHQSGQECFKRSLQSGIDDLQKTITNLDSRLDKQRFLKNNNAAFMLPKKFEFQGHKGDEVCQVQVTREVQEDIEKRYAHLVKRLTGLKTESEENWKTIETAEKTLLEMLNRRDYDVAHYFSDEAAKNMELRIPETGTMKLRADHQETEAFYLNKFREYTVGSNLICRLQSRYEVLRRALGDEHTNTASPTPTRALVVDKPRRRRIGRTPLMGQPKLFGGSLEEYLEATHQDIPLILRSCVRVINLYGLHHQGIFRVSGSQLEINNFRECFEKMEDPLADVNDASDMNSVAGVLKLYFRELREPLFPTVFFDQFMEIAQVECKQEFISKLREVVTSLPRPVFIVMRYLFAFLNHLSEFSDENMMDPYNLAICFGPTLVPIPEDKDQVQFQNLVNELIKNIIIFSEDIFPADGGPTYEKFLSRDSLELEADVGDAPNQEDLDSEHTASEDADSVFRDKEISLPIFGKGEVLEAVAQFDFVARSDRELSFSKGEVLVLHSQVSSDWWRGAHHGRVGLIPDKYILLKIRDEDNRDRSSGGGGDQQQQVQLQRRPSSSSDSITSSLPTTDTSTGGTAPPAGGQASSASCPSPGGVCPSPSGAHTPSGSSGGGVIIPGMPQCHSSSGGSSSSGNCTPQCHTPSGSSSNNLLNTSNQQPVVVTPQNKQPATLNGTTAHSASQDSGLCSGSSDSSHSPLARSSSPSAAASYSVQQHQMLQQHHSTGAIPQHHLTSALPQQQQLHHHQQPVHSPASPQLHQQQHTQQHHHSLHQQHRQQQQQQQYHHNSAPHYSIPHTNNSSTPINITPHHHQPLQHSTAPLHQHSAPTLQHSTPPLQHSTSLPPSNMTVLTSTHSTVTPALQCVEREVVELSSSVPQYTTLPRMHISLSSDGASDTDTVGVTVAHSMLDVRQQQCSVGGYGKVAERTTSLIPSSDPASGFGGVGGTVVAIETSGGQRRPSHSSLSSSSSDERLNTSTHRTFREMRTKIKPVVVGAPDLVMDLPVTTLSSSPRDRVSSASPSPSSSPSPSPRARSSSPQQYRSLDIPLAGEAASSTPSPDMTAAECFAKQNQSTLKKTPVTKNSTAVVNSSTDAQTQTLLLAGKSSLSGIKSTSLDVSQLAELKITESGDHKPSNILQQRSVEIATIGSSRAEAILQRSNAVESGERSTLEVITTGSTDSPLVEVRSAAPPHPITPSTPRLAARYLQAVAAASGSPASVTPKPQVRVKPTVMKKPSLSPAESDTEQTGK
uniref:SLIT-ROBO Rho GTPase-activating protein 1-like n=3 Tax=Hirondellea gigas TaxID=1518452 RepID=A0A6A7FXW2_9CRUS